jgi:hypothetical protein
MNPVERGFEFHCAEKIGRRDAGNNEPSVVVSLGLQLSPAKAAGKNKARALGTAAYPLKGFVSGGWRRRRPGPMHEVAA